MAKLNDEQKAFIVCGFARWSTRSDILTAFEEQFGFRIDGKQLDNYNLDGWRASRFTEGRKDPMKKWRPLFTETRKAFVAQVQAIPIANPAYRLTQIQSMFEKALGKKNYHQAATLLEQAAKEAGGAFTNTREVKGKVDHRHEHEVGLSPEEKRNVVADKLAQALEIAMRSRASGAEPPTAH
ncbi:DUF2280 domain-containing protein [Sphingobium xenophagum]|uniref:DUF2280 domain-containing protein n=1 Tax=Sphingobium xenophagum TaxID=121428 RepID=UPI0002DB5DCC|nr:DUF2280 domain-containing protein [Sphingobium xenophagum]